MDTPNQILLLSKLYAEAAKVPLTTVSKRLFGSSARLALLENGDLNTRTADATMQWFSDHWPNDTKWPNGIARPNPAKKGTEEAVAAATPPAPGQDGCSAPSAQPHGPTADPVVAPNAPSVSEVAHG